MQRPHPNTLARAQSPVRRAARAARGWLALFSALAFLRGPLNGADADAAVAPGLGTEYRIKAAFLYNFSRFVEWPPHHFNGNRPLTIGVLGDNPFGGELENIARDRRINGRAIVIVPLLSVTEVPGIDVAFVARDAEHRLDEFMPAFAAAAVLTVGESEEFTARGGIIELIRDGDKVRFEVNLSAAERQGLKLSAQLLKLATTVHRKS